MSGLCLPGQPITGEPGYLRGHGSYIVDDNSGEEGGRVLYASVAGQIERVNKLISVRPLQSRYLGEVGDLVVGRVSAVEAKRWKADINATKDAVLQLSSVNLAEGAQRMRTHEDQMQMRQLLKEGDLVSAEIQNIGADGTISLHTRSLKYGKLENGQLITVPAALVKRLPQHYITLQWGVDVILGRNGSIWITRTTPESWKVDCGVDDLAPTAEALEAIRTRHANTPFLVEEHLAVARVFNIVTILKKWRLSIEPTTISKIFQMSLDMKLHPKDLLGEEHVRALLSCL
jgi:exosome complex component RRP4